MFFVHILIRIFNLHWCDVDHCSWLLGPFPKTGCQRPALMRTLPGLLSFQSKWKKPAEKVTVSLFFELSRLFWKGGWRWRWRWWWWWWWWWGRPRQCDQPPFWLPIAAQVLSIRAGSVRRCNRWFFWWFFSRSTEEPNRIPFLDFCSNGET